jgi:enoyl-CoA hydratase
LWRVHASAIGIGTALAGGCNIALASDVARFSFTETKHGIPPTLAMSAVMSKVPAKALAYFIYSGEEVSAQEAVMFGLVSQVYPQGSFDQDSNKFIAALASRPRLNLEVIKKFQQNAAGLSAQMASEYAGTLLALVR